jgi:hypothetical protein
MSACGICGRELDAEDDCGGDCEPCVDEIETWMDRARREIPALREQARKGIEGLRRIGSSCL